MSDQRSDVAGAAIPPPLIYVLPLIAGIIIGHWFPLVFLPPTPSRTIGALVLAAGLGFGGWARLLFLFRGTSVLPFRPTSVFVTDGPFRISRNPI